MTKKRSIAPRAKKNRCADGSSETPATQHIIAVAGENGWAPAEELKERALGVLSTPDSIALDFSQIDYLEASGLQVVLAISAEYNKSGRVLDLINVSSDLRGWFEQCGAADHLSLNCAVTQ